MSFLEEVQELKNDRNNKENIVVNDIVNYFREKMENEKWKTILKENYIKKSINEGKNSCDLRIEFWEYSCGCSPTNIRVWSCGKFEIVGENGNYDSYYNYKGIRLQEIHKRICTEISKLLKEKLEELGLKIISSKRLDNNYRFNYYVEDITFSW